MNPEYDRLSETFLVPNSARTWRGHQEWRKVVPTLIFLSLVDRF